MASIKYKTEDGYVSIPMSIQAKTNEENGNGIGTCSTSTGTALTVLLTGYELVQNGFVAVTFENDVPAGATLNINSKGAKPIIYKGAAIEADTIKADDTVMFCYDGTNYVVTSLGGGGAVELEEYLSVSLTCSDSTKASSLIGATVVVTNTVQGTNILSTTWQGTTIECSISMGAYYTVTVGSVTELLTPSPQTFQAKGGYTRNLTIEYFTPYVDFGLPSGLKWATCNVGANSPWEAGDYFSWGNVAGHNHGGPDTGDYSFSEANYNSTTGHNLLADISPGSTTYDAARVNMGGTWKMPTKDNYVELQNYTDAEWVTDYKGTGVSGLKVMKKSNHDIFIFIPAFGFYSGANTLAQKGSIILYWLATYKSDQGKGYTFCNTNGNYDDYGYFRPAGLNIRAVK